MTQIQMLEIQQPNLFANLVAFMGKDYSRTSTKISITKTFSINLQTSLKKNKSKASREAKIRVTKSLGVIAKRKTSLKTMNKKKFQKETML